MSETPDPLRYPIGPFRSDRGPLEPEERARRLREIAEAPAHLEAALKGLSNAQLDTRYREGGWTLRQVAHHVPDSHLNGYVRMRWALTEDEPLMKVYDQPRWAELPDAARAPVELSVELLGALHRRWLRLLNALEQEDFARRVRHPDSGVLTVDTLVELYAWHGRHHVAHITGLRERKGW